MGLLLLGMHFVQGYNCKSNLFSSIALFFLVRPHASTLLKDIACKESTHFSAHVVERDLRQLCFV